MLIYLSVCVNIKQTCIPDFLPLSTKQKITTRYLFLSFWVVIHTSCAKFKEKMPGSCIRGAL